MTVYDCKDNTHAVYKEGKIMKGWKKYASYSGVLDFAGLGKKQCEKGESHIKENLDVYRLKM